MRQRAITAVFFAAAMIGGVYGGPLTFFLLFLVVAVGSLWELMSLLTPHDDPHRALRCRVGIIVGALPFALYGSSILFHWPLAVVPTGGFSLAPAAIAEQSATISLLLQVAVAELLLLFGLLLLELYLHAERPFPNVGNYLLGLLYVGMPLTLLIQIAYWTGDYGPHRVFGLMWLVWTNDTAAYLIGSQVGKNKLFPRISPKKTWEGTIAGAVCTLLMAWGLSYLIQEYSLQQWLAMALVAAIMGTLGDLVESMLKRSVGVKDSGSLFPGHGGFLDRFDAFLFVQPFAWAALLLLGTH